VAFDALPPEVIRKVVDKLVAELAGQLAEKKIALELTEAGRAWLAERGFDKLMGARPMARLIQNEVKKPLAEKILFGELKHGGAVRIAVKAGALSLEVAPAPAPAPPAPAMA
jgi:ATP-dependent Clp protease ATP-binding subunit ClpA